MSPVFVSYCVAANPRQADRKEGGERGREGGVYKIKIALPRYTEEEEEEETLYLLKNSQLKQFYC